ncbi:MAG: hypothetical protein ACLFVH_10440 [Phycisphaerae bacterium]
MKHIVLRITMLALLASAGLAAVGCGGGGGLDPVNSKYVTEERKVNGLVIILPGIEGISQANMNIRKGLLQAGADQAIMIYSWNRPGVLVNQVDFVGNRIAGAFVARVVKQYQDLYPGKPVHIIGHSGGGGVAVFAAESMGNEGQVTGLILLSASISKNYDLTKALRNTRDGIVNFYNPRDTALLGTGTTLMGTVDGDHAPAAGLNGFDRDFPRLIERRVSGGGDPHYVSTKPWFVANNVAPLVQSGPAVAATESARRAGR